MSFGILMPEIEHGKSTDQNVADVPSGDLISRADAIEAVQKDIEFEKEHAIPYEDYDSGCIGGLKKAIRTLNALPSADRPQVNSAEWVAEKEREFEELHRPKGEWLDREDSADAFFLYKYECSLCGGKAVFNSTYCPNCGAKMIGE